MEQNLWLAADRFSFWYWKSGGTVKKSTLYENGQLDIVDPGAAADIACPTQNAQKTKRDASQKKIVLQVQIIKIYTSSKTNILEGFLCVFQ